MTYRCWYKEGSRSLTTKRKLDAITCTRHKWGIKSEEEEEEKRKEKKKQKQRARERKPSCYCMLRETTSKAQIHGPPHITL